jgi:CMP-N-acetylneuraminic acid synthetase/predicted dehydrogenase
MINGKRVLAYIPARSGSKSIKDKNLVDLGGIPLIAHTIIAAKGSKYVDRVIVSTDSEKYAEISRKYGAETPFIRPAELATDTSSEMLTTLHLIDWIEKNDIEKYDLIVKLEPTSPLRITDDIDRAIEKQDEKNCDSVITITETSTPQDWINTLPEDESMIGFRKKISEGLNRQEMPKYYQLDGLVYVAKWNQIKDKKSWYEAVTSFASITPKERAVDVDSQMDLEVARVLIKNRSKQSNGIKIINNGVNQEKTFLVVGLGSMGKRRVRNLLHLNAGNVIGFDLREDRRSEAEEKYGINTVTRLEEGLQEADVVIISTSPEAHLMLAKEALLKNKPCFMELNVGLDKYYDEVMQLQKEKKLLVAPSCTRRFKESIKQLKLWIDEGKVGKVLTVNHHWGMNLKDWHSWEDISDYYVGVRETGGAREMVSFELSWIPWLFGNPKEIIALKKKQSDFKVDIDDVYQCVIVSEFDVLLNMTIDVISRPPQKTTVIIGEKGKIVFDEMLGKVILYEGKKATSTFEEKGSLPVSGYLSSDDKYVAEMNHFLLALKGNVEWPYTLEEDKRNLQFLELIEKSANEGTWVKVKND